MLNGEKLFGFFKNRLCAKANDTVTLLENNLIPLNGNLVHFNNFWEGTNKNLIFTAKI